MFITLFSSLRPCFCTAVMLFYLLTISSGCARGSMLNIPCLAVFSYTVSGQSCRSVKMLHLLSPGSPIVRGLAGRENARRQRRNEIPTNPWHTAFVTQISESSRFPPKKKPGPLNKLKARSRSTRKLKQSHQTATTAKKKRSLNRFGTSTI